MLSDSVGPRPEPAAHKPCRFCGSMIPKQARTCKECRSDQGWLGFLSGSGLILSLLVALFSVLSTAIPVIIRYTDPRSYRSDVVLQNVNLTDRGISLIMHNRAHRPGFVRLCKMKIEGGPPDVPDFNFNLDERSKSRVVDGDTVQEVFFKIDERELDRITALLDNPDWRCMKAHFYFEFGQWDGFITKDASYHPDLGTFYFNLSQAEHPATVPKACPR